MSELGQLLRKARMEKGISLDSLQETTKIQKRYLEAIEEGNYKTLPGSFYVRAFIKSYAEAVGLEPNEVLGLYRNVIPSPQSEHSLERPIRRRKSAVRNTDRLNKWISGLMLWSFIILIAGIIYYYVNQTHQGEVGRVLDSNDQRITDQMPAPSAEADSQQEMKTADQDSPPPPPQIEEPKPQPDVKLAKTVNGQDYYDVLNADKLSVEMKVTGDNCWIEFDEIVGENKMDTKESKTLVNGDTRTWELNNSAFLIVGKANAIEIKVNGTLIPVGDSPNPKRFEFDLQSS